MTINKSKSSVSSAPTKAAKVLRLLQRNTGATITELAKVTGWQEHSVRGFLSGTLQKKHGFQVTSTKEDGKARRYAVSGAKP